ncbi:hypothetical protein DPMN_168479 [Dreissena polymorpha]|uniref:PHD-type domain-containing protein n=1 Tax=Dreissena polymorpha TaxID=45954 RepID=A0A9D4F213_DREPO|nr:hypothetical protein DPMN_168479 [Dreissena polymorpha]
MACEYHCVYCARNVGEEDKAISCDECERWQHLSCETGVSLRQYRKMMKGNAVVTWKCCECSRLVEVPPEVPAIVDFPIDDTPEVPEIVEIPMDVPPEVPEATNDISVLSDLSTDSRSDEVEDRTFNVNNREINQPNVPLDVSLRGRPLDTVIQEDGPVTYEGVTGGTKRGGKKLISSDGHSYTAKVCKNKQL